MRFREVSAKETKAWQMINGDNLDHVPRTVVSCKKDRSEEERDDVRVGSRFDDA